MAAVVTLLVTASGALAAVYVVNEKQDLAPVGPCEQAPVGNCTLREAVSQATGADSITLPAGEYVLTQGELLLQGDKLNGAGARSTVIDGGGKARVMVTTNQPQTPAPVPPAVTGVTIRGGSGIGTAPNGFGGGVLVLSGSLTLNNGHVVGNTAGAANAPTGIGGGLGLSGGTTITMIATTVTGNTTSGRDSRGGGIGVSGENVGIALRNSTVSGNTAIAIPGAPSAGGGIHAGLTPRLLLINATIAGNAASASGGVTFTGTANNQVSEMSNTILASNSGGACPSGVGLPGVPTHHNLVQDSTCALSGTGDIQGVDAQLLGLANNGGPTDTRALPAGSPAIDKGGSCEPADQRGIARPPTACDIGAFEYVAPTLTVTTSVINDNGGTAAAITYRVTRNGADVAGSPAAANATFTLEPGTFNVSAALAGYTVTIGGDCSLAGDVTLGENQNKACTFVANDNAVVGFQLPPPVLHKRVNMIPARGTIRIRRPGAKRFTKLADNGAQLPVGTTVDALKGRVTIVAASDTGGGTDTALFYGGIFKIGQTKGNKPITILSLTEKLRCPSAGTASISAKRKKRRRLWGDGEGRFRTKGRHSAATVVGTKWLVEDRCKSTLTRVVRGRVSVRDFEKKKTVTVRRGRRYIARAG